VAVFNEKYRDLRPVIFDVLGPDHETSLLPDGWKLILHINPQSMSLKYATKVERIQTKGGFVEQHWGDDPQTISFEAVTGAFMRLYTGLVSTTEPGFTGGTRRETLAYDSYLDFLSLFHGNGSIYDTYGQIAAQGIIKITFDGGVYLGWFSSFSVTEAPDNPFRFSMTSEFTVSKEIQTWRTVYNPTSAESR
jgi:hypothetical protein